MAMQGESAGMTRREFLGSAAAVAAVAGLSVAVPEAEAAAVQGAAGGKAAKVIGMQGGVGFVY